MNFELLYLVVVMALSAVNVALYAALHKPSSLGVAVFSGLMALHLMINFQS